MGKTGRKKHTLRNIILVILALFLLFFVWVMFSDDPEDYEVASSDSSFESEALGTSGTDLEISNLREHYVNTSETENVVMMVYMIGSDLESEDGAATADLDEMMDAALGDNLQVVVETGGAYEWMNSEVSADANQRWELRNGELAYLGDAADGSMTDSKMLSDFISWTAEHYPADRYMLVLWDHGGGTLGGFGYDELADSEGFTLATLSKAVEQSGVTFDIIGFDACLMATIENAYALEPYADYLLASEELEPGDGWYYTDFLTKLGENPSMDSIELGKNIIDDFGYFYDNESVTLSLTDLREIPYVYEQLGIFLANAQDRIQIDNSEFRMLSQARNRAREYSDCDVDQIDIADMVNRTKDIEGRENLLSALDSCVKYHNNSTLTGSEGLAMYFPYRMLDYYSDASKVLENINYDAPISFYDYFLGIMAGGQQEKKRSSADRMSQDSDYSGEDWYLNYDTDFDYGDDYSELYLTENEDGFVLDLDDAVWQDITDIQLAVMMEYENGYLDLGYDNVLSENDEGDFIIDFAGTWISIGGVPVSFQANKSYENEQGMIFSGTVDALLNDEKPVRLVLEWEPLTDEINARDDFELKGQVMGYHNINEDTLTQGKGLHSLKAGDTLSFVYDYYDEDYNYIDTLMPFDAVKVNSQSELKVSYADISDSNVMFYGILYDIYQQELYTETLEYTD